MEIKQLTIEELNQLMHSEEISGWTSLPISPFRLMSQMKNPHLLREDIVMVIALENNDLVGYMGALPDDMLVDTTSHHVAWASCIWTRPAHRRKGLGQTLTSTMNAAWNDKLFLTEFTTPAKAIYDGLGSFESICTKKGYRYFYRSILHLIAKNRLSNNKIILGLLRLIDGAINIFLALRITLKSYFGKKAKYRWREYNLSNIPQELFPPSAFVHVFEENNWIFFNPWLSADKAVACEHYFFPTLVDKFQFRAITFINRDNFSIALLIYSRINNECKILSFSIINAPGIDHKRLKKSIEKFFLAEKVNSVLSYDLRYDQLMRHGGSFFFYRKKRRREYLAGRSFIEQLPQSQISVCEMDGDVVFT